MPTLRTRLSTSLLSLLGATSLAQAHAQTPRATPSLELVRELHFSGGTSTLLCFSPDGSLIASAGELGDVLVFDVASGALRHRLEADVHGIRTIAFSPDGRFLAAARTDIWRWDLVDGSREVLADSEAPEWLPRGEESPRTRDPAPLRAEHPASGESARVDEGWLEIRAGAHQPRRYRLEHRQRLRSIAHLVGGDGRFAVARGWHDALRVLSTATGDELSAAGLPKAASLIDDPDSPELVLLDLRRDPPNLERWLLGDRAAARCAQRIGIPGLNVSGFVANGQASLVGGGNWLTLGGQLVDLRSPEAGPTTRGGALTRKLVATSDGSLSAAIEGHTRGLDTASGALVISTTKGPADQRLELGAFPFDLALTGGDERTLWVATSSGLACYDLEPFGLRTEHPFGWSLLHVLRDGTLLAAGHTRLLLWDPTHDRELADLDLGVRVWGLSVSDDERRVAVTLDDHRVLFVSVTR